MKATGQSNQKVLHFHFNSTRQNADMAEIGGLEFKARENTIAYTDTYSDPDPSLYWDVRSDPSLAKVETEELNEIVYRPLDDEQKNVPILWDNSSPSPIGDQITLRAPVSAQMSEIIFKRQTFPTPKRLSDLLDIIHSMYIETTNTEEGMRLESIFWNDAEKCFQISIR